MMWPVMGVVLRQGTSSLPRKDVVSALILQVMIVISALIALNKFDESLEFNPIYGARWGSYEIQEGTKNRDMVLKFFNAVRDGKGNLGVVMADEGSITMVKGGKYQGRDLLRVRSDKPVDTIIAMLPNKKFVPAKITKQIDKNQLSYKYCMIGTSICIFTNRIASDLGSN